MADDISTMTLLQAKKHCKNAKPFKCRNKYLLKLRFHGHATVYEVAGSGKSQVSKVDAVERFEHRCKHPSLSSGYTNLIPKEYFDKTSATMINVRETSVLNEKLARIKAWELNKEVFPRESELADEQTKFFVWSQSGTEDVSRRYIVDSGASCHLIAWRSLTSSEKRSIRKAANPQELQTANGIVRADHVVDLYVVQIRRKVTACLLADVPPVLSMSQICSRKKEGCIF